MLGAVRARSRDGVPVRADRAAALFLYTRADTIYGGSNQIQRNIIGERALGLPPEPKVVDMTRTPTARRTAGPGHGLLAGKTVLVTAAAGTGIGFATAKRCVEEGAGVVDQRHPRAPARRGRRAARRRRRGRAAVRRHRRGATCRRCSPARSRELGELDVLVNNAGLGGTANLVDMTDEQWVKVLDVTLNGTFRCVRAALRHMQPRHAGVIVNNASVLGWRAQEGQAHYAAAKAGVMALTRCAAIEAADYGVRVNAVAPSLAMHPFLAKVTTDELLDELDVTRGVRPRRRAVGGRQRDRVPRVSDYSHLHDRRDRQRQLPAPVPTDFRTPDLRFSRVRVDVGVAGAGFARGDVERGVAVEEAERREQEARVLHRHDRPVLRPHEVRDPNVYQTTTSVSTSERSAAVQRGQAVAARVLVRVLARGAALVGAVRRDPEVVLREPGPLADARVGVREQRGRRSSSARACTPSAARAPLRTSGFTIFHARDVAAFGVARARELGVEPRVASRRNAFRHGLSGPGGSARPRPRSTSLTGAVDVEVEPGVEQVLVVRRGDAGARSTFANSGCVPGSIAIGDTMPVSFTSSWMLPSR